MGAEVFAPFSGPWQTGAADCSNYGTSTNYQAALFTETRLRPLGQQMPADRRETQLDRTAAFTSHIPRMSPADYIYTVTQLQENSYLWR